MSYVLYRNVAYALLDGMNAMAQYPIIDARWIFAVPLYHLLTNAVKPFSKTSVHHTVSHQDSHWWGIADFVQLVERFKKLNRANM